MFELYSYWTWIPAFLWASEAADGNFPPERIFWLSLLAFATIAIGGVGCVWGGRVADRIGRERFVIISLVASGACSLLIGLTFGMSWWIGAPVALAWGFFVVADSAQFSVLVTESVPPHAVGTALMVQTSLGFLLTTLTIQLVPPIAETLGWRWAFPLLALGPIAGVAAIRRLRTLKARQGAGNIPAGSGGSQLPSIAT
jgi:MFS family permease